jgi:histone-lysine N-methyltransferase SUV420H
LLKLTSQVGFSAPIQKISSIAPLMVPKEQVIPIIECVAAGQRVSKAIFRCLELLEVSWPEILKRLVESYIKVYLPEAPFKITTTNRYKNHEACVVAKRPISKGIIEHLGGILFPLTEAEEELLELSGKSFTIMISTRKGQACLYLGGGRFVNHDCLANSTFSSTSTGVQFVATRDISEGQEITAWYGDDYFGENNRDCLCSTCKQRNQNGWVTVNRTL